MNDIEDLIRRKAVAKRLHNAAIVYDRTTGGGPVYSTEVGDRTTRVNTENLHPAVAAKLGVAKAKKHRNAR